MKERTKSSTKRRAPISGFRTLFEDNITVKAICEDLYCVEWLDSAQKICLALADKEFDVAGVRKSNDGRVCGYIRRQDLTEGICGTHALKFDETILMSDSTPLIEALYLLSDQPYWFVLSDTNIKSIVTRADLQKPPIRILIFGIITLLEMNLTDLIRKLYGKTGWVRILSKSRRAAAAELLARRQRRQEEIDLLECTQFCDKRDLIKYSREACHVLAISSKTEVEKTMKLIEVIRDQVAHGQDLLSGSGSTWGDIISALKSAEYFIKRCEIYLSLS